MSSAGPGERPGAAGPARPSGPPDPAGLTVGVLGGTGPQGRGLARRLALAGQRIVIGSRVRDRAEAVAASLRAADLDVTGTDNATAAEAADLVIVAVPYEGHRDLLVGLAGALAGKVVVDCVNPVGFDKLGAYPLPVKAGSAAQEAAAVLPASRVVAAFHHVSAVLLEDPSLEKMDIDILVLGDDREATDVVQALAGRIAGMRGIYAGRLRNAGQVEALTANLISINRRHKSHAGIRVTGV